MSDEQKEDYALLERAEKWLHQLDTDDYHTVPELVATEIADAEGKHTNPFGDLLTRAMTNYQISRDLVKETAEKSRQGILIRDLPYMAGTQSKKFISDIETMSDKSSELLSRTILERLKRNLLESARDFLYYIDYGIVNRMIVVGQGLERKLTELEKEKQATIRERDVANEQLAAVSTELISVRALYEECERKRHIHPASGTGIAGQ